MGALLLVFGVMAVLAGGGILGSAQSVFHEIFAVLVMLAGVVSFVGYAVVEAINKNTRMLVSIHRLEHPQAAPDPRSHSALKPPPIPPKRKH
jgi:hypothetical protein